LDSGPARRAGEDVGSGISVCYVGGIDTRGTAVSVRHNLRAATWRIDPFAVF